MTKTILNILVSPVEEKKMHRKKYRNSNLRVKQKIEEKEKKVLKFS